MHRLSKSTPSLNGTIQLSALEAYKKAWGSVLGKLYSPGKYSGGHLTKDGNAKLQKELKELGLFNGNKLNDVQVVQNTEKRLGIMLKAGISYRDAVMNMNPAAPANPIDRVVLELVAMITQSVGSEIHNERGLSLNLAAPGNNQSQQIR